MNKYQDIINKEPPEPLGGIRMPLNERAKIFGSFMPLKGYEVKLEEKARHKTYHQELSEDEMWKYYLELMDLPDALQRNKGNDGTSFVENKRSLIDYSGDDLSLDPNMW